LIGLVTIKYEIKTVLAKNIRTILQINFIQLEATRFHFGRRHLKLTNTATVIDIENNSETVLSTLWTA
jgi:hypothetical protein